MKSQEHDHLAEKVNWLWKLDAFLQFNQLAILEHSGRISMEDAKRLTLEQYHKAWINLSQGKVIEVKEPACICNNLLEIEKEMGI
jgi:hypothetical protein